MILWIDGHCFHYEMENLCRVFFPYEPIQRVYSETAGEMLVYTALRKGDAQTQLLVKVQFPGKCREEATAVSNMVADYTQQCELQMALLLFEILCDLTGYRPDWGVLTGVRPAKLMRKLLEQETREEAFSYFTKELRVSAEKTALTQAVIDRETPILQRSTLDSFSLYIAIPFCPTRCHYCSFVSHSISNAGKYLEPYLERLCRELESTALMARELGLTLRTVYIGGGTPTTLDVGHLRKLLQAVQDCFPERVWEYTLEAGRPDTITQDKLQCIRDYPVTRISINPQTMQNALLEGIGRAHTVEQTVEAYKMARDAGFDNINMDLIAGLPEDTTEGYMQSLEEVLALCPQSVTVHTLALKRASSMVAQQGYTRYATESLTGDMLRKGAESLARHGILPYYMYRQSRTVGNLENVGYAQEGYECQYNIYMMDETHTVLGVGAGAVTKLKAPDGPRIERIYNFKYPYEYCNRFEELITRKEGIRSFYADLKG